MKVFFITPVSIKNFKYTYLYDDGYIRFGNMPTAEKCLTKALRTTLVVLFILQLLSTVERQIFDFLGYMWAPIIGNFFQIIVVILGIFGACNFYRSCIVVYATWNLLWLGWNIFVICLYLEVGILNRNQGRYILTIGTESKSWWLEHGIGCEVTNSSWEEEEVEVDAGRKIPPESLVVGCILQYYYVEVIHAAIQCLLSLGGFVASCICIYCYIEEDDPMSSANDELEFVKMRYRTPTHMSAFRDDREDMAFDNLNLTTELSPHTSPVGGGGGPRQRGEREMPPSYDSTMRNNAVASANQYYASGRQSVRSKASTRSKRSTHRQASANSNSVTYSEPVRDLPWVQITPLSDTHMIRHYP